jgi:SAM-dependent methyltransferase
MVKAESTIMRSLTANSKGPEGSPTSPQVVGLGQHPDKLQGHWILARAGKRVLRPGGLELTRRMLDALAILPEDRVVEFAPGLGVTARIVLEQHPLAYRGVEREPAAAEYLRRRLSGYNAEIVLGQADKSGLPVACASVVYGEAMLSMQSQEQKNRIFTEARRLLTPGGRYGIHELCFLPEDISDGVRHEIQAAMSREIHAGVQPLTRSEWIRLFEQNGMKVIWSCNAPMHLLEPRRMLQDEGLRGGLRIAFNIATNSMLRHRILAMRQVFRKYGEHLGAISLVGQRETGNA